MNFKHMRTNWKLLNEGKAWRQCQHICCDSQWPWLQGATTVTAATTSQLPKSQSTKLNKSKCSQFWMEGSCFQEKSSWKFIFHVVCAWKCVLPEVPQKHSPVLYHSAPKVAGGFGSGEQRGDSHLAHTLSTCSCRQASLSSLLLPLAVFSKEAETLCLPALFILCFTKSHVLLPLTSTVQPLKNEACSLISWRKNSCLGNGNYWQILKIMEYLCQKNASHFFICPGKVLLLHEAEELLSFPMYSLIFPGQHQDAHSPFSWQIPPSQQWVPHLSSHQLIPTSPQGLRPGQGKLTSKVVEETIHKTVDTMLGKK